MRKFLKIDPRLRIEKIDEVFDQPLIIRVTDFDEEALEDFENDLDDAHATGQSIIPICIDSYGGSSYGVLGMIAAIEQARVPVATILTSKAMSAGAVLFMFGTEGYRFMHPHASMMIHDVSSGTYGKIEEIKVDARNIDELNKSIYKRASVQIGKQPNFLGDIIKSHNHVDWFLDAKEAKKHNIANHLKIPCFDIEIQVKIKFS